jgi:hypothetical protein
MTTGFSYDGTVSGTMSYIAQVAAMAVVQQTDSNFTAILPMMITYAENRMCRDLDFLVTVGTKTYTLAQNVRSLTIPSADFVTLQQINVISPYTITNPDSGTRNSLLPVTKEYLDIVYPSVVGATLPQFMAMLNTSGAQTSQNSVIVGPWPDQAYTVEVVGTTRPQSLSATNLTTFISLYLPDLMLMASMVYISAYQRNFSGSTSNDPAMPVNYESQYQTLLKGAEIEEARKKFQAGGWTSMAPAPLATPTRG